MDDLSGQWIDYLRAERIPPNTIARRASVLRSIGNAGTATREEVEAWWATRRDMSAATRSSDLASLRSFYRWAHRWEHRDDDPTLRLDAPKVDKGLPRPVTRHDLRTLLDRLPDDSMPPLARDRRRWCRGGDDVRVRGLGCRSCGDRHHLRGTARASSEEQQGDRESKEAGHHVHHHAAAPAAARRSRSESVATYRCVVSGDECPRSRCTARRSCSPL